MLESLDFKILLFNKPKKAPFIVLLHFNKNLDKSRKNNSFKLDKSNQLGLYNAVCILAPDTLSKNSMIRSLSSKAQKIEPMAPISNEVAERVNK